jgi:hypothetical protein
VYLNFKAGDEYELKLYDGEIKFSTVLLDPSLEDIITHADVLLFPSNHSHDVNALVLNDHWLASSFALTTLQLSTISFALSKP